MAIPEAIRPRQGQDPTKPLQLLFGKELPQARSAYELHELIEKGFPSETVLTLLQNIGPLKDRQAFAR